MSVAPTPSFPIPKSGDSTLAPLAPKPEIDPKIKKTASEFESMVLSQLLQPMFEALDSDGIGGGGSGERMFRPLLIDQYAQTMAKAGGIGIAEEVAREMMRLQGGATAPDTSAVAAAITKAKAGANATAAAAADAEKK